MLTLIIRKRKKTFQCDLCDYSPANKQSLIKHIKTVHQKKCHHCEASFASLSELKEHFNSDHKDQFTCEICVLYWQGARGLLDEKSGFWKVIRL